MYCAILSLCVQEHVCLNPDESGRMSVRRIFRACPAGRGDPLSSPALTSCGIYSATTSCLLSSLIPFVPALRPCICFSLSGIFFPFQGFSLFILFPSFTLVFRHLLKEAPYLKSQGLLTSPMTLTFLLLHCRPPATSHVCMCVHVHSGMASSPAVQGKCVWMTASPAPSFLSVYNFKKIYLQKYDSHFITFIRSTMDKERR